MNTTDKSTLELAAIEALMALEAILEYVDIGRYAVLASDACRALEKALDELKEDDAPRRPR